MINIKSRLDLKSYLFTVLCFMVFSGLFLHKANAEVVNLMDDFDYSSLSILEIQQEIKLLYKYAKRAYADNDFELSKLLFYQILEFDPGHPGANKYLDYYIPKKISKSKYYKGKEQKVALGKIGKDVARGQAVDLRDIEKQVISSERDKRIKDKYYKSELDRIAKEEKQQRGIELKQRRKEEAQRRKQLKIEEKEQARIEKKKQLAAKKKAQLVQEEKRKEDTILKEGLSRLVKEEKEERSLALKQRKKEEAQKRKQEAMLKKEQARLERERQLAKKREIKKFKEREAKERKEEKLRIAREKREREPPSEKRRETKKIQEKTRKLEPKDEFIKKIVEREIAVIQNEEKRLAKEEALRRKVKAVREKKEMAKLKKQNKAQWRDVKSFAKLSKKTRKKQIESKSKEQKSQVDKKVIQEDLEKYLLEQKKLAELKLRGKEAIPEGGDKITLEKIELSTQVRKKPKEKVQEPIQKRLDITEALQKDSWDKVKALYNKGINSYRAGEYEKALESFAEILAQN